MSGKVYLIPNYLSDSNDKNFIPVEVQHVIKNTSHYLCENIRTARRFISSLDLGLSIEMLTFSVMDKNFDPGSLPEIFSPVINENEDLGILSEAGLPAIADPGQLAVQYAHKHNVVVKTLPGTSSMILALISSGFTGQQYTFHGYLPIDKKSRSQQVRDMEKNARATGYTQLFMETPYRNKQLFQTILNTCHPDTLLYIGINLTGENEFCLTQTIKEWKNSTPQLHKIPAMFGIGVY